MEATKISVRCSEDSVDISIHGDVCEKSEAPLQEALAKINRDLVKLDLEKIGRINSLGVKHWMVFLKAATQGRRVELYNCPPVLLEYSVMAPGVLKGGHLVSFIVSFICPDCAASASRRFETKNSESLQRHAPKCQSCGTSMQLELDEAEIMLVVLNHT